MTCKKTDVHLYDEFYLVYGLVKEMYFLTCKRSKSYCQGQSETKTEGSKTCSSPIFCMLVRITVPPHKLRWYQNQILIFSEDDKAFIEGWQSFLFKQWSENICPGTRPSTKQMYKQLKTFSLLLPVSKSLLLLCIYITELHKEVNYWIENSYS